MTETPDMAARRLAASEIAKGYELKALHAYVDERGEPLYWRIRLKHPNGEKWVRPMYRNGAGYVLGEPKCPPKRKPLYALDRIAANPDAVVWIAEGENCADALNTLGLVATTSGSATSADGADWSPLVDRNCIIWPDNDNPGQKYADDVTAIITQFGCSVEHIDVAALGLEAKHDVVDWLARNPTATKDDIDALPRCAAKSERPRSLMRALPPAESFPVDAMGELLGSAAKAIHDRVQAPLATCCQSVLATATLCVQPYADVLLPIGQVRPLSCYFSSILETGGRKTAADNEAGGPIRKHEMNLREKRDLNYPDYINRQTAWEAARKKATGKKGITDFAGIKAALDKVGPEPEAPLEPLLTCPEPTFEGLCKLLAIGQPAMGICSSEGGQFLGGHAMNEENKLKTASGLSEVWDGSPIRRVRSGDGTLYLPGRRVSMHLQVQPGVGDILFGDATLADQGLLSRILVSAPVSTAGTRFQREENPETAQALKRYNARMLEILQTPLPLAEGKRNELQPRHLAMSAHAIDVWRNYADHLESQLGPNGEMDAIRGLANKLPEHAARLAGVLTLVENINASSINADHMRSGIALADHYAAEALRLFGANKVNADLKLAQRLLDHLHTNWAEPAVSLPDIYQRTLNAIGDKAAAARMVRILEDHGWLRGIPGGATINGERRREAWSIVRDA